ncbi:MAG: T9SS type A sorting domain-containing protein [Bacteroidales bacterium]|nr:T9SS type A sorting domain-containing protein [Bacteroidales bacterium]
MDLKRKIFFIWLLGCLLITSLKGQETISAAGGTATGSGGKVTYTVGQLVFNVITGTNFSIVQGVQQPYEISVATAIEGTEDITLECVVYPNPTEGSIRLVIRSFENDNMRFRLYDMNGILLQDKKIEDKETEISMDNLSSAIYFLKVIKDNIEVKVFKIIKR